MSNLTAVEWLQQILQTEPFLTVEDFNKAKEMERQQLSETWDMATEKSLGALRMYKGLMSFEKFEDYFEETFNK